MCDCYVMKCSYCGEDLSVHLGDFSAARDNVVAFCAACHAEFLEYMVTLAANLTGQAYGVTVFADKSRGKGHQHGRKGVVFFVVTRPRGVHLN